MFTQPWKPREGIEAIVVVQEDGTCRDAASGNVGVAARGVGAKWAGLRDSGDEGIRAEGAAASECTRETRTVKVIDSGLDPNGRLSPRDPGAESGAREEGRDERSRWEVPRERQDETEDRGD